MAQTKQLNKMNGDSLTQLKYIKKAEVSSRVLSFNMASKAELVKNVRWSYNEQRLNVEKMRKRQTVVYRDLVRLQQQKRVMLRETHAQKHDDKRHEKLRLEREDRIKQFLVDYDEKSKEMKENTKRKKRKRRKLTETNEEPADNETKSETETLEDNYDSRYRNSVNFLEMINEEEVEPESVSEEKKTKSLLEHRRSSKTMEVSVGEPKTIVRTQSQEEIELHSKMEVKENDINAVKLPAISSADDKTISEVRDATRKASRQTRSPTHFGTKLPFIVEKDDAKASKTESPRKVNKHDDNIKFNFLMQLESISSCSSQSSNNKPKMSNFEYMKGLQKRREMEKRKILDLPYGTYTEDEKGRIVPMDSPPKPFHNVIPTNKHQYEKKKILETQYKTNAMQGLKLKNFFAKLEKPQEDDYPMLSSSKKPQKVPEKSLERRNSLSTNMIAMAALIPTFLQDENEAPSYVRQIDMDEIRMARARGRRSSSWAPIT